MRIVLYELRKIFAARYIIVAAVFTAIFMFLYTHEGVAIVGAYSNNFYLNDAAFSPEPTAPWPEDNRTDSYNTYKWFVDTFGAKVTDETITAIEQMEYPELDKLLGTLDEFAEFGVHNTAELAELIDKTIVDEYFCYYLLFGNLYWDKFQNIGITNEQWNKQFGEKLRNLSLAVPNAVTLTEDADLRDTINEQWRQFLACTRIRKIYLETQKDPIYIFDAEHSWDRSMSHTLSAYRWNWLEMIDAAYDELPESEKAEMTQERYVGITGSISPDDYEKRMKERVNALGDDFFYVRNSEIFYGWEGTGLGIIELSAILCIIFAAPYAVADKRNIVPLQYTTKCGRKIERKKMWAVVLMAVIVSLISSVAVLLIMPHDVCAQWFGLPLTSFSAHDLLWLDVNMWQYIALYIGISFIVNISTAVIAYTICGLTGNVISAVCISVPLIIAELLLWTNPLSHIFSLPESAAETPVWCIGIIVAAVLGAVFITKRSRKPIL